MNNWVTVGLLTVRLSVDLTLWNLVQSGWNVLYLDYQFYSQSHTQIEILSAGNGNGNNPETPASKKMMEQNVPLQLCFQVHIH